MVTDALPKLGMAAAIMAAAFIGGVVAGVVINRNQAPAQRDSSEAAAGCTAAGDALQIAADPGVAWVVQQLADDYTAELLADGRECIPIEVTPTSSAAAVGRLTNGWKEQTHGPTPDVWIPQSTLWVELLRTQLDNPEIVKEEPSVLARSPTVLAMPRAMAEALGWPERQPTWQEVLALADSNEGWAAFDHPEWGQFRLRLTDPRYNITGLQALLALDSAQQADVADDSSTALNLFRVQRALSDIDTDATEELEIYSSSDDVSSTLSAVPLEERQVWRFNQTGSTGDDPADGASGTRPDDLPDLVAVYPEGNEQVAMESDYPYLVLDAPWVEMDVLQYADEFGDYLRSDAAVEQFQHAGFRSPDNEPSEQLASSENVASSEVARSDGQGELSGDLPNVDAVRDVRSTWVTVPRLSTTLYLVDVSGSMQALVPDTDKTRLEATVDAAKQSLDIVPPASDVGLWEFSTDLAGGENGGDYRRLVDIGPLTETVDGTTRSVELVDQLDGLEPRNDTALNDTVLAAYSAMRADYTPGQRHTIMLLTDGRNDDETGISDSELIESLVRLRKPDQPIQVVSIAYGDQPDIDTLAEISGTVGGKVLAAPNLDNLDRLFIEALAR